MRCWCLLLLPTLASSISVDTCEQLRAAYVNSSCCGAPGGTQLQTSLAPLDYQCHIGLFQHTLWTNDTDLTEYAMLIVHGGVAYRLSPKTPCEMEMTRLLDEPPTPSSRRLDSWQAIYGSLLSESALQGRRRS